MAFFSGIVGFVEIGSVAYAFSKWKLSFKTNLPKVNNFTGGGYQQLVPGITSGTVTLTGPYNEGSMPLTVGTTYSFILGFTSGVSLTVTAIVESLEPEDDVDGNPMINVTAQTTGTFTGSIV